MHDLKDSCGKEKEMTTEEESTMECGIISEAKCRYCGRMFVPASHHALRDTYGLYCKPTCFLHRDEVNKRKTKKVEQIKNGEVVKVHASAVEAAMQFYCDPKLIRYAIKDGTTYRGFIWRYKGEQDDR